MPIDRMLVDRFAPLASDMFPDAEIRRQRAVAAVINEDATVDPDAIRSAAPWQIASFRILGPAVFGPRFGGFLDFPQGARIHVVSVHARTAPTGTFRFLLLVNGAPTDYTASLGAGKTSTSSGAGIDVPPGGILTLNVLEPGDAADLTINVHYGGR